MTTIDGLRKQPQSPKRKEETYPPINNQTKCFYAKAMKQLTSWMLREGRIERDPLVHLSMWNVQVDVRHPRRSLTDEEFSLLRHAAAKSAKTIEGMTGPQREFLFLMARMTGLRRGELASLTAASFLFDEPPRLGEEKVAGTVFNLNDRISEKNACESGIGMLVGQQRGVSFSGMLVAGRGKSWEH
ncbi:hypothetical protein [Rhodopirellula bahusiensis]|uniref:hypothetical protein n=1 Tax=Rhodopirellula bahusiensis TaxID=2014065 RepID=UPI0032975D05